jgi:hypothetical protein
MALVFVRSDDISAVLDAGGACDAAGCAAPDEPADETPF